MQSLVNYLTIARTIQSNSKYIITRKGPINKAPISKSSISKALRKKSPRKVYKVLTIRKRYRFKPSSKLVSRKISIYIN